MYKKNSHIHFIGIGGIGMSALARILRLSGYTVSGCDPDLSQNTIAQLKQIGCLIYDGNNNPACIHKHISTVVYIPMYATTIPAVKAEIKLAEQHSIPAITRAQMLNELMRSNYSIAVSGSHGKTTTSGLISHILMHANYDPTIAIGGNLKNIDTNARIGNGNFFVAEADESDRSFLQLNPTIAVVTNISIEHLETYADLDDIKETFKKFITNVPFYGKAIICIDSPHLQSLLPLPTTKTISYGLNPQADIYATDITLYADYSIFTIHISINKAFNNNALISNSVTLSIPGIHNIYNSLAAIATGLEVGIPLPTIIQGLAAFKGIERRFSFHGTYKNATVFDDYGHHPEEIKHTITVARKKTANKLIVVFQPHRYTRTEKLWTDFISLFSQNTIDTLIITDIYSAGEQPINTICSQRLVEEIKKIALFSTVYYAPCTKNLKEIVLLLEKITCPNDLILLLGAGRMHHLAAHLI